MTYTRAELLDAAQQSPSTLWVLTLLLLRIDRGRQSATANAKSDSDEVLKR